MKNGETYFKYAVILAIFLILAWFLKDLKCRGGSGCNQKTDTIRVVRDTTYILHDTVVSYVPKPYKVILRDTIETEREVIKWETIPSVLKEAYSDYNSTKYYKDSFDVDYGKLYVFDTLHKNSITGSSFRLAQSIPEIKETVTLREAPRVKGFIGLGISGNVTTPLSQTEISFGLLMKNNSYYGVKGILQKEGTTLYGIEYKRLITFKKR